MMQDDTAQMLADQLDRVLTSVATPQAVSLCERTGETIDSTLDELGLDLAMVSESRGGAGLSWREMGESLSTFGYHAAPSDLPERIVSNAILSQAGAEAQPAAVALDALQFDGKTVTGTSVVPWAAELPIILSVYGPEGQSVAVMEGGARQSMSTVGRIPTSLVTFDSTAPIAVFSHGAIGPVELIAVLRAAQIAGALSRCLELSIEHGNTRIQFGRPIGKFQAVQHMIAELAAEAAAAQAGVNLALNAIDAQIGWEPVAVAKIRASRAVRRAVWVAQEVHGAMGVTEEHRLHQFTRRLWQWREEAGNEHSWSERLGRAVLERGADALWPSVVGYMRD